MIQRSRRMLELYTKTVKMNNAISEEIRQYLKMSDEGVLYFGDEEVKSPGQLGIKILQLIDQVKDKIEIEKVTEKKSGSINIV